MGGGMVERVARQSESRLSYPRADVLGNETRKGCAAQSDKPDSPLDAERWTLIVGQLLSTSATGGGRLLSSFSGKRAVAKQLFREEGGC